MTPRHKTRSKLLGFNHQSGHTILVKERKSDRYSLVLNTMGHFKMSGTECVYMTHSGAVEKHKDAHWYFFEYVHVSTNVQKHCIWVGQNLK